jgi:hypothetical protein
LIGCAANLTPHGGVKSAHEKTSGLVFLVWFLLLFDVVPDSGDVLGQVSARFAYANLRPLHADITLFVYLCVNALR